jgi:hypothetical protein
MKYLLLFVATLLFESVPCKASLAASYTVKINQPNVHSDSQPLVCHEGKECLVPIILEYGGKQQPVIAHVMSGNGVVTLKVQTRKGYLYVAENAGTASETSWHKVLDRDDRAHGQLTLFLPEVPEARIVGNLIYTHEAITDLWISVEPSPK